MSNNKFLLIVRDLQTQMDIINSGFAVCSLGISAIVINWPTSNVSEIVENFNLNKFEYIITKLYNWDSHLSADEEDLLSKFPEQ